MDCVMLQNQKTVFSISLLAILSAQPVFSNEQSPNYFIPWLKSSFVATLSAGPSWESAGRSQTLDLAPGVTKTFTTNRPTSTPITGAIFLGIQTPLPKSIQGQIGLDFTTTGSAHLSGNIWDDADPTFNNYDYQYQIKHSHVALKGKLLSNCNSLPIIPWISAAVGVGYNTAFSFSNSPTISEAITMPNFNSRTKTSFTYTLGFGVQHQLSKNWQAGIGYEFADWGKSQLAPDSSGNSAGLSLSHLYTNSLLFNFTYLG